MVKAIKLFIRDNTTIDVLFNDGLVKRYDVLTLSNQYPQLLKLKDRSLFVKGKILGTSGVVWNDELDIEGQTIYNDGTTVTIKESIDKILLGFSIKEERLKQGLSQQDIALRTGIDQGDISKIESGLGNPTINTINKICSCLNKTVRYNLR